jgi:hypothetical protein
MLAFSLLSQINPNPDQQIAYTSRIGNDQWKQATTTLSRIFDVESSQIHQFIEDSRNRAVASGWLAIQGNIIDFPDLSGTSRNLIKQYGQLIKQNFQEHMAGYLGQNKSRRSQNAQDTYFCIMESLTESRKNNIVSLAKQ